MDQVNKLDWLEEPTLIKNMNILGSAKDLMQVVLAQAIIAAPQKVHLSASISDDPYDFFECSNDVFNFVWAPAKNKQKQLTPIQKHMQKEYVTFALISSNVSKLVGSSGITLFDVLNNVDHTGRFVDQLQTTHAMEHTTSELNPVAGYGVPSTKFSLLFNPESNQYQFVIKTKKVLESMRRARISQEDKLHYELLLKMINSAIDND